MRTATLRREFEEPLWRRFEEARYLTPPGTESAYDAGMIGHASIFVEGARYVPDSDGAEAFITPVIELGAGRIEQIADADAGEIVDLIAWHPAHPERWALRTGEGTCLGYVGWWQVEKPTRVWRSPLAWLRARCDGIVLLTHDADEQRAILMQLRGGVLAEDRRHAAELRAICEQPYAAPRIGVA